MSTFNQYKVDNVFKMINVNLGCQAKTERDI